MARFATKVVDALYDTFVAQMATEIAAVEADEGLTAGDITPIREFFKYRSANEYVSPSLSVTADDIEITDQQEGMSITTCRVVMRYISDAELSAGELEMRRYVTAMVQVVRNNWQLGGVVIQAVIDGVAFYEAQADNATFLDAAMLVNVEAQDA